MIARGNATPALGEQHPLEPARSAPPVVRRSPHRARRIDAEPIELLPPAWAPPRRPRSGLRIPWAVFPAAAVLGTALHYAARVHMVLFVVLATVTFAGAFWWFNRWALESWEETKRENGW